MRGALAGIRDATELPILWCGGGTPDDAQRAGADAVLVVAEDARRRRRRARTRSRAHAAELGLDLVVSVSSEEVLERVLELHDPETFHLATDDLERALELLTDVPVGKLAIAEAAT